MTDLLTPPAPASGRSPAASIEAPPARRVQRPRWRDTRLILGVLLILLSVVLGARFINGATRTSQWLSVTRDLPAGHLLVAADLAPVKAHLDSVAGRHYFAASAALTGRTLGRPVAAGELLPVDALSRGQAAASRIVPVVVKAGRLPQLQAGDHVDVYVLARATGAAGREVRVLTDVEFIAAETIGTGESSIQLRVSPQDAISAVAASQSDRVDVVRVERDSAASTGAPGPSTVPAYGVN